jgi:hypothetical protein
VPIGRSDRSSSPPITRYALLVTHSRPLRRDRGRSDLPVAGVFQAEGVGNAVEKGEDRRDVDRLPDLRVAPAGVAQALDVRVGGLVGVQGDGADQFQQRPLGIRDARPLEIPTAEGIRYLSVGSL